MIGAYTKPRQSNWDEHRWRVWERDRGHCWVCGRNLDKDEWELGHLVDYCAGGLHDEDNLAVMCRFCNRSKPVHETMADVLEWRKAGNVKLILLSALRGSNADPEVIHVAEEMPLAIISEIVNYIWADGEKNHETLRINDKDVPIGTMAAYLAICRWRDPDDLGIYSV